MFISAPAFEQRVPRELLPPGGRAWRVLELSLLVPWYVVTVAADEGIAQTFLVAWDSDLLAFLEPGAQNTITSLTFFAPPSNAIGNWTAREVRSVWKAWFGSGENSFCLSFRDDNGEFWNSTSSASIAQTSRRELLMRLPT